MSGAVCGLTWDAGWWGYQDLNLDLFLIRVSAFRLGQWLCHRELGIRP